VLPLIIRVATSQVAFRYARLGSYFLGPQPFLFGRAVRRISLPRLVRVGIIEGPVLPNFPGPFSLLLSFGGREHSRVYFGSSDPAFFLL